MFVCFCSLGWAISALWVHLRGNAGESPFLYSASGEVQSMWRQLYTHMQSLSQSPFLSLSLSFIMYPLFTCSQTPHSAQYLIIIQHPVCVSVSLHHVCRLMINLHANVHYKLHICPQALLTLMRRDEYGRTAEVWAWWWWSIFFHNPILHVRDGYG